MTRIQKAILKTLIYADIFDYPLTQTEIQKWLIQEKSSHTPLVFGPNIKKTNSYYHLQNRQSIVKLRRQRTRFSRSKLKLAQKITRYLKLIPSIQLIAITGALAMNNSNQHDDIDLMIITKKNRLWLTRLFSIFILEFLHLRRRPNKKQKFNLNVLNSNKICLNLFLDESSLQLPSSQRNLYTAHEVAQIKPIFDKGNTYQNFISQNSWVTGFLPNAISTTVLSSKSALSPSIFPLNWLENLAYKLQLLYMKSKITNEKITPHSAFFHPRPTNKIVLKQYHQKIKKLL